MRAWRPSAGRCRSISPNPAPFSRWREAEGVTLTVVGPELPLSVGVVDLFRDAGQPIVGPTMAAARLETSKAWAKSFMARHGVPTAPFELTDDERGRDRDRPLGRLGWPLVIKADGLAAGKGVVLADGEAEAIATVRDMMSGRRFGDAGRADRARACLRGPEVSYFVLTDGATAVTLGTAQDHKRAFDGDRGPNTGGMGAFAPSPLMTTRLDARVLAEIVEPVLAGMREEGHPYTGFLYCGLMLTAGRADGDRVQRAARRSRSPGAVAARRAAACRSCKPRRPRRSTRGHCVPWPTGGSASSSPPADIQMPSRAGHRIEGLAEAAALVGRSRLSRRDATPRRRCRHLRGPGADGGGLRKGLPGRDCTRVRWRRRDQIQGRLRAPGYWYKRHRSRRPKL